MAAGRSDRRQMPSARARSPPMCRCATRIWCRRRASSTHIAAGMASALSDQTTAARAVTSGPQSGFDVDIGSLSAGNTITVNYTDSLTNTPHTSPWCAWTIRPLCRCPTAPPPIRTTRWSASISPAAWPRSWRRSTPRSRRPAWSASNPSGTTLRVLDDGAGNIVDVNSLSTTTTATSLTGGSGELPFFTDGSSLIPARSRRSARRASDLPAASRSTPLLADPSKLVAYQAGTAAGDSTRPNFIYQQLTSSSLTFRRHRHWHHRRAVYRLDHDLPAPGHQPAGRSAKPPTISSRARTSCSIRCSSASTTDRRQYRSGNGQSAHLAEFLCRQCARAFGGEGHVRHPMKM